MGKTGFKTFVCSFSFSLLAFVGAGKEFLSVNSVSQEEIVIPNKNISLFFKDIPSHTSAAKIVPIKKIALRAPEPSLVHDEDNVILSENRMDSLPFEEETVINSHQKKDLIPLTFAQNINSFSEISSDVEQNKDPNTSTPSSITPKVSQEPQKIAQAEENPLQFETPSSNKADILLEEEPALNTSNAEETFKEAEPFSNKILYANVQIIRPNEKNIKKLQNESITQDDIPPETPSQTEEKISALENDENELLPDNDSISTSDAETHVIAMVPDNAETPSLSDEQNFTDNEIPAFKIAKAKLENDNFYYHEAASQKKEGTPKSLLIPIEKANDVPHNIPAKVLETPEKNRLAMLHDKASIHSMEKERLKETKEKEDTQQHKTWQTMAEKNNEESTWIAAKGSGYVANKKIKEEKYYKSADKKLVQKILKEDATPKNTDKGTKLASETVDNILIPIPEEILNDPNLTPQLVSSSQSKELEEKLTEKENLEYKKDKTSVDFDKTTPKETKSAEKSGLLKSLTSIFSKNSSNTEDDSQNEDSFFSRFRTKSAKSSSGSKILPTEIRLAFQPNRAEISGVTLKWLQAFANKIIEDEEAGLEIRINGTSSYELQQKRLNLLNNILASNGVDFHKVKTIFTTREPNSFVIRTVRLNNENGGIKEDNDWQDYYKVW